MGCVSSGQANTEQNQKSRQIDDSIKKNREELAHQTKLLLIGAGESGKSTILKQLKVIHENGYTEAEKMEFKYIVYGNIIYGMQAILEALMRKDKLPAELREKADAYLQLVEDDAGSVDLSGDIADAVRELWSIQSIKDAFHNRASNQIHLGHGIGIYLDNLDKILEIDYVPSEQDILLSRVKTTGVVERSFEYKKMLFRIFDVGGQRSERKKWIHCFEDVTCLIFCVASSEYDEVLIEDETINRMNESLILFDSICNNRFFEETSIILFLNKMDLFKEKIKKVPISVTFPEYDGEKDDWEASIKFIEQKFKSYNTGDKSIYAKQTCATDTDNIRFMFEAVTDIIVSEHLKKYQLC